MRQIITVRHRRRAWLPLLLAPLAQTHATVSLPRSRCIPRNPRPSAMRSRLLLPPSWRSWAPPPRQRHRRDRPLPPRAPHAQPPPRERCPTPRPSTTRSLSPPISVTAFSAVASASTPSPRSTSTISSPRTSPPSSTSAVTTPMGSSLPVRSRRSQQQDQPRTRRWVLEIRSE